MKKRGSELNGRVCRKEERSDFIAECTSSTSPSVHSDHGHQLKWHLNDNLKNQPIVIVMIENATPPKLTAFTWVP